MNRSPLTQFEKTPTEIFASSSDAATTLAAEVRDLITANNKAGRPTVLGLATGSTPIPFYRELIRLHEQENLSFKNVLTFNLDEYYGIDRNHPESYFRFMHDQLFDHVDIPAENVHVPDGTVAMEEVFAHCEAYENSIEAAGGLDLQILGIGRTGHIGFNEPGSTRGSRTRLIALDRITRSDAAPEFLGEENVPRFAITMGVGTILEAKKLALMAWGDNKADIVREAVEGPESEAVSASFLQSHPDARFLIDEPASRSLTRIHTPWLVGPVNWSKTEAKRAVIWLSEQEQKPVLKLIDEEYNENGMGELLTRHRGSAYDLNIDVFNTLQHTISGWPGGKPDADDSQRPEKATPHPKKILVFSPEPEDELLSMAGTIERLISQGHDLTIVYQTSGNLRVSDSAATNFARILLEQAGAAGDGWKKQEEYARLILQQIDDKGPFGEHPTELRQLKALIRRGEAHDAGTAIGLKPDQLVFLDLPFYERGRYRRFRLTDDDINIVSKFLCEKSPHQIYATGQLADPSSVQSLAFQSLKLALETINTTSWVTACSTWLYRGHQKPLAPHQIGMAVPLSPDQLALKVKAIQKYQAHSSPDNQDGAQNRLIAARYDSLGMAEYEAIEAFERLTR